uniref:Ig-like domain-containing protein n=1 Tax=Eptatretus burgeri TaxID=7764 RepID=A0A8C4R7J0_EPTBU
MPASITRKLKKTECAFGSSASMECKVSGTAPLVVTWYKDGDDVHDGDKYHTSFVDNIATLIIQYVESSDKGNFTCKASNSSGSDTSTASLAILEPPTFARPMTSLEALPKSLAQFETVVHGSEPLTIKWYKDEQEIKPSRTIRDIFENSKAILVLERVDPSASGCYRCKASNPAGTDSITANLLVKGV